MYPVGCCDFSGFVGDFSISDCINRMKAASTTLVYIMIREIQKET